MLDPDYRQCVAPHLRAAMARLRDPQAVWEIFRDDATVAEMERLTRLKRPAVGAASKKLLALGDWVREKDARKTFGKLARRIMEARGYAVEMSGVETPEDPLFTKGTRYQPRTTQRTEAAAARLIIDGISPEAMARLHIQAARNSRSVEAEAAHILTNALRDERQPEETSLAEAIHRRFANIGGVDDLEPYPDTPVRPPPTFDP